LYSGRRGDAHQHNIQEGLADTCNWLFEELAYCQWYDRRGLEDHHGLLWIKGKPGSGKSTLMKEAYRRAGQRPLVVSPIIAAFFFNARGSHLEKSPLGLFRSVLHQILQRDPQLLIGMLKEFREKERTRGESGKWEWHLAELQIFFKLAFTSPNGHGTIIFIDALDECDEKRLPDQISISVSQAGITQP
jgi:protein SERAC1